MSYELFGLNHSPFRARAVGSDVFVGPQQAALMSALKKALTERDAVISIVGPVGVGKSISLNRALDAVTSKKSIARIDRMQLGREEVLEALLINFDLIDNAHSTPQRFAAFRRMLNDHEADNTRVFVIVEDACRLGLDGLAELESLTSADSGDSCGANVILLGPPEFDELLQSPALARLRQRIRLRHRFEALSAAEVRGYVAHRVREAGGKADSLFGVGGLEAVSSCSAGIPRVVNTLCNAALSAAAEAGTPSLSAELLSRIAREQFGLDVPEPLAEPIRPGTNADTDTQPAGRPLAAPHAPADDIADPPEDDDIPELIQDTLPGIKALENPAAGLSHAQVIEALRDKTNNTQPALPVLDLAAAAPSEDELLDGLDADALAAEERRLMLEPRAPEPLTRDTADTQTARALDSALRPDTQLLEALDAVTPVLQPDHCPDAAAPGDSLSATGTLPTLSDSMRLDTTAATAGKKPDINALEAALAVARKGPIDLTDDKPAPESGVPTQVSNTAPDKNVAAADPVARSEPSATPDVPQEATPAAPQPPAADGIPEITLDDDIERQKEAARARLAAEAAKAAEAMAKMEKKPSEAERAAAAELAAEKKRLAGMTPIGAQFDAGNELTLEDTRSSLKRTAAEKSSDMPETSDPEEIAKKARLEKLAAELGSARSLEDIDDLAAETLFGEEFSQIAATIVEMAANDKDVDSSLQLEETIEERAVQAVGAAASGNGSSAASVAAPPATAQQSPAVAQPAAQTAQPAAVSPSPSARPMPANPPPLDADAARRLEMVRSLNKGKAPPVDSMPGEEIVLGEFDASPTHSGPAPEPIEDQFGTSMTANLKALSSQSIAAMQRAEEQTPQQENTEKKGGLLSRFRRS